MRSLWSDAKRDVVPLATPFSYLPHLDQSGYTPTASFFRQQHRQVVEIDPLYWSIRLHGLVRSHLTLTLNDLLALPAVQLPCTIACEGTASRNTRIGHAFWEGIPLRALLEQAGLLPEAHYAHVASTDGYATTLSIEAFKNALLAYRMNGDVLPREHGYPARLIMPGLYGHKMPKWIRQIEFTQSPVSSSGRVQGDIKDSVVRPLAVIFTPHHLQTVSGLVSIGGIAFTGEGKVTAIEISIDDASWMPVSFTPAPPYSWTPWQIEWSPPAPGDYSIQVQAQVDSETGISRAKHAVVVRVI